MKDTNDFSSCCVLVVDDSKGDQDLVTEWLGEKRFQVIVKDSPKAAISFLKDSSNRKKVDVILTDYDMPGMKGRILAQHIQDMGIEIPIFVHSRDTSLAPCRLLSGERIFCYDKLARHGVNAVARYWSQRASGRA